MLFLHIEKIYLYYKIVICNNQPYCSITDNNNTCDIIEQLMRVVTVRFCTCNLWYMYKCLRISSVSKIILSYYVIIIIIYNYTYNRVTSICIDLSKIKLFVFVFVDNMTTYFHNSNLQLFSITFPSHCRSDIHESDQFLYSVMSMC